MTNLITVFRKTDKTYGGSDYVEVNHSNQTYREGNTRSHCGFTSSNISHSHHVEVATKKALKGVIEDMKRFGYEEVQ